MNMTANQEGMVHQHATAGGSKDGCIFCEIIDGTTPADIVFDGGDTLFFRDISPKAKVHIVGIPKKHIESVSSMLGDDHAVIGKLIHEAGHVADDLGIGESGFRIITNCGPDAGQEVQHLHFHILGGEPLGSLVSLPTQE